MKIRQLALVARDLKAVEDDISNVLGIEVAYRDPGVGRYGLENAVWPVGDTFLEVVAPVQEGTTAGRYLESRGGDSGYMVILQADNIEQERQHIASLGIRVVEQIDRDGAAGTHLHPKDVPGAILSIDAMDPPTAWQWAGPDWQQHVRTETSTALLGATIETPDPPRLAARWAEVLQREFQERETAYVVDLDGTYVRFIASASANDEGMRGVDVQVRDPAAVLGRARDRQLPAGDGWVELCGVRFDLVPA